MLCRLRIKLTSPLLGSHPTPGGVRRFERIKSDKDMLVYRPEAWRWLVGEAITSLHMPAYMQECIQPPEGFPAAKIHFYTRKYFQNKKPCRDEFEAISSGTILTLRFAVTSPPPDCDASITCGGPPSYEDIRAIFRFGGQFLGMSPWGSKFGYGRFIVVEVGDGAIASHVRDVVHKPNPDLGHVSDAEEDRPFTLGESTDS